MKRTSRFFAVTALGVVLGALAAFGGAQAVNSAGKQITVGFVPGIASDPFFKAMQVGAEAEAKALGIKLIWQGSSKEYSPQAELPFVNAVLAQNPDVLVLVPTDPDALVPSAKKAVDQGIPVITVDTTISDASLVTSYITGDNVDGGKKAADTLASLIGNKGKVLLVASSPTATTNQLRSQGFKDELKNFPDIQLVDTEYAYSQPAKATSAVNTVLLRYPDLAGIFSLDGTTTTGAVAALRNANKVGKVKLVGYDAYPNEVQDLKAGVVSALIAQDPAQEASLALQFAVDKVTGDTSKIQAKVVIPNVVMTQDNLDQTAKYTYVE